MIDPPNKKAKAYAARCQRSPPEVVGERPLITSPAFSAAVDGQRLGGLFWEAEPLFGLHSSVDARRMAKTRR
jgi:hypothetical protein